MSETAVATAPTRPCRFGAQDPAATRPTGVDRYPRFARFARLVRFVRLARSTGSSMVALALLVMLGSIAPAPAFAAEPQTLTIDRAVSIQNVGEPGSTATVMLPVTLPDDWAVSRPHFEGTVWYRMAFDRPAGTDPRELLAVRLDRLCSNAEIYLNGQRVWSGGRMHEPVTRNCRRPALVMLPAALVRDVGNALDLQLQGHALSRVSARRDAGGLSAIEIGPLAALAPEHERALFRKLTLVEAVNLTLVAVGCVMIGLGWLNRREAYLGYFGWMALVWGLLSARVWWRDVPWDNGVMEFLYTTADAPLVALAVQFLLSYAGLRSRWIENGLAAQWLLLPATLLLAGPGRLFVVANVWHALFALEIAAALVLHVRALWQSRRNDTVANGLLAFVAVLLIGAALGVQFGWLPELAVSPMQVLLPLLFIGTAGRLLLVFARTLRVAEAGRDDLEARVQQATAEMERNFAQLAELRVEQVTEKERKRIAADLHDDLGAKLLTIVHTSESERISTLAREALEEMRLSVRGLTGRPMRLADALADWRAETVLRLGQANIEADWRSPAEETEQLLPARGFVQTTRILREAVSNIIKHSEASHCKVRCAISERQFGLTVQDNGKGIPMELDGRLDRGHGMSSMKHRAKQMQGQCLVESGPGYGTVIRLTLPL